MVSRLFFTARYTVVLCQGLLAVFLIEPVIVSSLEGSAKLS
jgi:hypothetical protein